MITLLQLPTDCCIEIQINEFRYSCNVLGLRSAVFSERLPTPAYGTPKYIAG